MRMRRTARMSSSCRRRVGDVAVSVLAAPRLLGGSLGGGRSRFDGYLVGVVVLVLMMAAVLLIALLLLAVGRVGRCVSAGGAG